MARREVVKQAQGNTRFGTSLNGSERILSCTTNIHKIVVQTHKQCSSLRICRNGIDAMNYLQAQDQGAQRKRSAGGIRGGAEQAGRRVGQINA